MSDPLSDERIAAIQARVEAITEGWWYIATDGEPTHADDEEEANSVFIGHAPQDMRDLLAEVARLKALCGEGQNEP